MFAKLRAGLAHAFSTAPEPLSEEDARLLDEVAARIKARRLTVPAMLALDVVKHTPGLHMVFFGALPVAEQLLPLMSMGLLKTPEEVARLTRLSDRREHIEALISRIEASS